MKPNSIEDVFEHELKDLYSAEEQLVTSLPKMAEAATDKELKADFEEHLEETKGHVDRLEAIGETLDVALKGSTCEAMTELIKEGGQVIRDNPPNAARDAALIGAAKPVEEYEIAAYGTTRALAKCLGHDEAVHLLGDTLQEEKEAVDKLTALEKKAGEISVTDHGGG